MTRETKRQRTEETSIDEKTGLYIIKQGGFFFLFNIKEITLDEYPYDHEGEKPESVESIYYVYVNPNPSTIGYGQLINRVGDRTCRMIHIIKYHSDPFFVAKSKQLQFNDECEIGEELSTRDGTRDMMNASLYICNKVFGVNSMYLRDTSFKNGLPVQDYNFLLYGQSWYQRHFGANPVNRVDRDSWKHMTNNIFSQNVTKSKLDQIISSLTSGNYRYLDVLNQYIDKLGDEVYEYTWNWFFRGYDYTKYDEIHKNKVDSTFLKIVTSILGFIKVERWIIRFRTIDPRIFNDTIMFKTVNI